MGSDIANSLERRAWLKYFRDMMAQHQKASMFSQGIIALNNEIDAETKAIGDAIQGGSATMEDLFLLLDYPPFKVGN